MPITKSFKTASVVTFWMLISTCAFGQDLQGKAIICKDEESENTTYRGYEFVDGLVVRSVLWGGSRSSAKLERYGKPWEKNIFVELAEKIFSQNWVLNRKTLEITYKGDGEVIPDKTIPCEVYLSQEAYAEAFQKYKREQQTLIDLKMEGNRI